MTTSTSSVVVGYDDSEESAEAVRWAAKVAARRGAPLLVVAATGWEEPPADLEASEFSDFSDRMIHQAAARGARIARDTADIDVRSIGVIGSAATALQAQSADAQLLVVGHRGRGELRGTLLGSVAFAIATHATCPVAVVRGDRNELSTAESPVVVAVDGSAHSDAALMAAAKWTAETRSVLRVVVAWRRPFTVPYLGAMPTEEQTLYESESTRASRTAAAICRQAVDKAIAAYPALSVQTAVAPGRPAEVIVDAAHDASIIVMGARGRGGFASLLLGSVSREVMEHAGCPVYIVR